MSTVDDGVDARDPRAEATPADAETLPRDLTERERAVLHLYATGLATGAVARRLGTTEATVKGCLRRILRVSAGQQPAHGQGVSIALTTDEQVARVDALRARVDADLRRRKAGAR